jgi:hypothetical protein
MTIRANTEDPRIVAGMAAQGRLRESRLAAGEQRVGWKAGLGTAQAMQSASIAIIDLGDPTDIEQVLAENLFHRAFLLGPFADVSGADLGDARLSVTRDDDEPQTGIDPAATLGDLVEVIRAVADQVPWRATRCARAT